MYNFYSNLKAKNRAEIREHSLVNTLGEILIAMYKLRVTNSNINPRYFLEKLITCGVLGVVKINDELFFGTVTFSEVNPNDTIGKNATVVIMGGDESGSLYFEDWRNNPDVSIVRLNSLCQPDFNIFRYGYMLAQIDNSMLCNVVNTRLSNVFKAKDSKSLVRLEEALRKSYDGDFSILVDEFLVSDELGASFDVTELNKSDKISNIQYLSVTRSYIMNTFYSLYGMYAVGGEKIAQQSVEEINQGTNASWILPKSRLEIIREDLEELNRKFGANWSIDFSECWKLEDENAETTAEDKKPESENENENENENEEVSDNEND